ncbi:MAG: hypothetical protein RLZZ241_1556 [Bacteroidota bacterium]|jgi:hypothetical protein
MFLRNHLFVLLFLAIGFQYIRAQEGTILGTFWDAMSRSPISGIAVGFDTEWTFTDAKGNFTLSSDKDSLFLTASGNGYRTEVFPIQLKGNSSINLGVIFLEPIQNSPPEEAYIELDPDAADETEGADVAMPLLRGIRDLFLTRAAFDFSPAFFKIRGQDSRETKVYLNGLAMNRLYDGRPAWSTWSGLTDLIRGANQVSGFSFSEGGFGGVLGAVQISASPAALRRGTKLTSSFGNSGYQYRLAGTYNSGMNKRGLGVLLSLSRRWGNTGTKEGTPLEAYAGYLALEWQLDRRSSVLISALRSVTDRATSAPLTQEVVNIKGHRYNPQWGLYRGELKNARRRIVNEPHLMMQYLYNSPKLSASIASGYQWGKQTRTRLTSVNAPNPDPAYYRNLPSFYYNSPAGVNYENTQLAGESFQQFSQVDWPALYSTNRLLGGPAAYVILGDEQLGHRFQFRSTANLTLPTSGISLQGGLGLHLEHLRFSGRIFDLLGAQYHTDYDVFSNTLNDSDGVFQKPNGARVGYDYSLFAKSREAFLQMHWQHGPWQVGVSTTAGSKNYDRLGHFRNERYPEASKVKGPQMDYESFGIKATIGYRVSAHYWVIGHLATVSLPPVLNSVYIDPREHNYTFPGNPRLIQQGSSVDIFMRYPWLTGHLSGYALQATGDRTLKSYYSETAFGSALVREAAGDIGSRYLGLEAGMEFRLSSSVTFTWAWALGSYTYFRNPQLWLFCYPDTRGDTILEQTGILSFGTAQLKGYHLAQGPEQANSLGISYRNSNFWWVELRAAVMNKAYTGLATLRYTDAFVLTPETGLPDPLADPQAVFNIRKQQPLEPLYYLNLSAGKSWKKANHYLGFFLALNNLFNQILPTGGFHQGRLATFSGLREDQQSGHPSFGTKYWYGSGRTLFINLSWSF